MLSSPALPQALSPAATIDNTAYVTYQGPSGGGGGSKSIEVTSNTVTFTLLPGPSPAIIEFFAFTDPGAPGSLHLPTDGGQCRDPSGDFGPLPEMGAAVSMAPGVPVAPLAAGETDEYQVGQLVVVRLQDLNRNEDPTLREFVEITISTSGGDEETLLLQETGSDTGVFATAIPSVAIPPAPESHDCRLSVANDGKLTANYVDPGFPGDTATTVADIVDIPDDRVMLLQKQAALPQASVGDFVRYELVLSNLRDAPVLLARISDTLPQGFSYQTGSLRVDGEPVEPALSSDGRTLLIPIGHLPPNGRVLVAYVLSVGPSAARGEAVNSAIARGAGGAVSNIAEAVVQVREPLMTGGFTAIGRVLAGTCGTPEAALVPVQGARLFLEDGTYVATDENGAYHFEGVRPGTHVVQIDTASLPAQLEVVACGQDTRLAGRGHSRFVEAEGGALMRADFRVQPKAPLTAEVGLVLSVARSEEFTEYEIALDASGAPAAGLKALAMLPEGATYVPASARLDGEAAPEPQLAGGIATFGLGDVPANWRGLLTFRTTTPDCSGSDAGEAKGVALFEGGREPRRTPPATAALPCDGASRSQRQSIAFQSTPAADDAVSPFQALAAARARAAEAQGPVTGRDWLAKQGPGNAWLLPSGNAASPTEAVVVKHLPRHAVVLRHNGQAVSGLHSSGTRTNPEGTVAVSMWRGIPMQPGDNVLQADIVDPDGKIVQTLERALRYSNSVARAEVVEDASLLVADGIHKPVVAVRMLDGAGKPVRAGVHGSFTVAPPYVPAQEANLQQQRQLAGLEAYEPTWRVEGDEGIAYIELQPTTTTGEVVLGFDFRRGEGQPNAQELKAWLKAQPRDWIIVGFAKGTVGYDRLNGNVQAVQEAGHEAGISTESQLSLYAKGRVLGKWMLTLAYDSDKPTDDMRRKALLSTIDPDQFYTLYGDGTQQGYDAASVEKVYLKLERDQFYALFGDFTTGLDDGELTRYHRVLNGLKVEYQGPVFELNAFAARTRQDAVHEELQGDGTSGLYRLARRHIAINGERVRIEVRDRYRSELVLETRILTRHIDYDIDYTAGTLFFREPIHSRDFDFNPIFIVVDYETHGDGDEYLAAGGRAGVTLLDGRLQAGLTLVQDEDSTGRTTLAGLDASYKVAAATELRAEVAASEREQGSARHSGDAYLVELEHRGERLDVLAYVRRSEDGFGFGQQGFAQRGMFKVGADAQWRIADTFALQAQAWHQEDLVSGATRQAAHVQGEYQAKGWGMRAGLQWIRDEALDGRSAESQLLTLGANKILGRLELTAQAAVGLGASESVDFPARLELGASYALTDTFRVLVAQEFTDGASHDTSTTRAGFQAAPWAGATLTSTLNQSQISEHGPRSFAVMGLSQRIVLGANWSVDLSVDGSRSFNETGSPPLVVNPAYPVAPGGVQGVGALTEDFLAVSGGVTYRAPLWSVTGRLEHRDGAQSDRAGITSGFLRQAQDGIAFGASVQAFSVEGADGSDGLLANAMLAWAWRPLGSRWSLLDRLEFRLDEIQRGGGQPVLGQDTLAARGDARTVRLVNNLVLNFVGDAWNQDDRRGNLFNVSQRSQLSLYYGSKYVFDTYDDRDYAGYTDILGVDWRHDLSDKLDVGLRASVRHAWDEGEVSYAFGPSFGFTPFTNAWFSVGYNVVGFDDRDFQAMHYTAQGPYLMLRFKFDQETLGLMPDAGRGR